MSLRTSSADDQRDSRAMAPRELALVGTEVIHARRSRGHRSGHGSDQLGETAELVRLRRCKWCRRSDPATLHFPVWRLHRANPLRG